MSDFNLYLPYILSFTGIMVVFSAQAMSMVVFARTMRLPANKTKTKAATKTKAGSEYRIVILQRGWVVVGKFTQDGEDCMLENAAVIRTWGTSKGLTELAMGPLAGKTILDKTPFPVRFHELTVVATLDVNGAAWASALSQA